MVVVYYRVSLETRHGGHWISSSFASMIDKWSVSPGRFLDSQCCRFSLCFRNLTDGVGKQWFFSDRALFLMLMRPWAKYTFSSCRVLQGRHVILHAMWSWPFFRRRSFSSSMIP